MAVLYAAWSRAKFTAAHEDIGSIKFALDQYKLDNGVYPTGTNALAELVFRARGTTNWHSPYPYFDKIRVDPWGKNYVYECPGKHNPDSYDLFSAGPNGRIGTADDIGNWTK